MSQGTESYYLAPAAFEPDEHGSLRDFVNVLFRHKGKIFLIFATVFGLAVAYIMLSPEIYESHAKVLIRVGRESMAMDPSVTGPTVNVAGNRENEVNSELSILRSRILAEQVVDKFGPDAFLKGETKSLAEAAQLAPKVERTPREKAIKLVMKSLTVGAEQDSATIAIAFEAKDPVLAREALDSFLQFYQDRHILAHQSQASPEFFRERSKDFMSELTKSEKALEDFRAQNKIASLPGQKDEMLKQIGALQADIDAADSEVSGSTARIATLEASLANRPATVELNRTTGKTNFAADAIKEQLVGMRRQEADIAARYADDYRGLVDLRKQITLLQKNLDTETATHTEVTMGVDTNTQSLKLDLEQERAALRAGASRKESLQKALASRQAELTQLADLETKLTSLERDAEIAGNEYREYRDNLRRASISELLDRERVSNVFPIEPATAPIEPIKPRKALTLALGFFLAIFAGVGLAFAAEAFDDSLRSNEDIKRRLGVPVLATLSEEEFRRCT